MANPVWHDKIIGQLTELLNLTLFADPKGSFHFMSTKLLVCGEILEVTTKTTLGRRNEFHNFL